MGLITKEVEVKLRGSNVQHFENLGYKIPRIKNKYGKIIIPQDKETIRQIWIEKEGNIQEEKRLITTRK